MIKPLIVFCNVYDCEPVIEKLKDVPCDQLHINHFPYPENFKIITEFFNSHKDYTHLFYLDTDLILTKDIFLEMIEYVSKKNPPVYGVCFNVDEEVDKDKLACCLNMPSLEISKRIYKWVTEEDRQSFLNQGINILKVKFSGGLHFVRRDIFKRIPYSKVPSIDLRQKGEKELGYGTDLAFAHYCDFLDIPIIVDLRYKLKHLRYYSNPNFDSSSLDYFKYNSDKNELCQCRKI